MIGWGLLVAAAAGAAGVAWRRWGPGVRLFSQVALPSRMPIETPVEDISATLAAPPSSSGSQVEIGGLRVNARFDLNGRYRRAILASPPSLARVRVRVPDGAALRFGIGVAREGPRDRSATGVRFSISVDDAEIFERVLNPARDRSDQHWFDERVDLASFAGREVDIGLRTSTVGAGSAGGTAGWSNVRLVRRQWRERQPAGQAGPNVIVLLVDALRADRLGCYGAAPSPSPELDRLASTGLIFDDASAQSSWTLPSVASIFTGLDPLNHGTAGAPDGSRPGAGADAERTFLSDALPTVAAEAQLAAITTAAFSANPLVSRGTNLARGFETFVELGWSKSMADWASAASVNEAFLEWLRPNRRYRFFAYLHYMEPHDPYKPIQRFRPSPPEQVRGELRAGVVDEAARRINSHDGGRLTAPEIAYLRVLYDGDIRTWDAELGSLLQALAELELRDSTVLVVTADHGEEFQEHGRLKHGSQLYDESIRVPLVIAGPGIPPGRSAGLAQGIDLFPTIATILGLDASHLSGRNLLIPGTDDLVFSATRAGIAPDGTATEVLAVRSARWKLIFTPGLVRYELYDLSDDPTESRNRFGEVPEGANLAWAVADWHARAKPPPSTGEADPDFRRKLRALGYVD